MVVCVHCSATVGHFISIWLFSCNIIDVVAASIDDGKVLHSDRIHLESLSAMLLND